MSQEQGYRGQCQHKRRKGPDFNGCSQRLLVSNLLSQREVHLSLDTGLFIVALPYVCDT
jgi:hypothetical protein